MSERFTEIERATTELTVAGGPKVRIHLPPAKSSANFRSLSGGRIGVRTTWRSCPATSSFARGRLVAGMFQREEAHAAPSDFGQPKSGTDRGASVRSKSENSAAVTGRRRGRHGECAAGRGSGLFKAAGLSDGARLMADWRSAYHRCIAARPPDSSTGNAVNGEGAAGALSVVSVPGAWSTVPAFRGLCAATARDCTAALATGGSSTRTIFTTAAPARPRAMTAASNKAEPASRTRDLPLGGRIWSLGAGASRLRRSSAIRTQAGC